MSDHGTKHALARFKTMLAQDEDYSIGGEIYYHRAFKSDEWPRTSYAFNRPDAQAILALAENKPLIEAAVFKAASFADLPDPESQARAYGARAVLRDMLMLTEGLSQTDADDLAQHLINKELEK